MLGLVQWVETLAFAGLALAFDVAERTRPAVVIDRRRELAADVGAFLWLFFWVAVARAVLQASFEAVHARSWLEALAPLAALPSIPKVLLGLVLADFLLYLTHRAMHRQPWLWRTHRFHHSITSLYWLSGFRTSATHTILFALPQMAVPFLLLRATPWEAAAGLAVGAFFQLWNHANLSISLGPLGHWIVTPAYHRVHHFAHPARQGSNLGMMLTIWDRMFGTYVDPRTVEPEAPLGLDPAGPGPRPDARMWVGL